MANYATNIFHARTENKTDLDKIEAFLDDTFSEFTNRYGDSVDFPLVGCIQKKKSKNW